MPRRLIYAALVLAACGLAGSLALAGSGPGGGASPAGGAGAGAPAPPPPIPTTWRFENDVLVERIEDTNRDGKPDAWFFYKAGDLVRYQADRDFDGTADWRRTWPGPDPAGKPDLTVNFIDGRWRIVPDGEYRLLSDGHPRVYTDTTEKLVKGQWTGTFEDVREHHHDVNETEGVTKTVRWTDRWRYQDGKPVDFRREQPGNTWHVTWEEGRPVSWETTDERGRSVSTYRDGALVSRVDSDKAGTPTFRVLYGADKTRQEVFRDGKWTGTYENDYRDGEGRIYERHLYRDGRYDLFEQVDARTGEVFRRRRYAPDGSWVDERIPAGVAGPTFRTWYAPDGGELRSEKLVDGRWLSDFEEDAAGDKLTYEAGRLTRIAFAGMLASEERRVLVYPDKRREEWSDGRRSTRWLTYDQPAGRVRRLVREARDLDGDGRPDLKVDYDALTIEQPKAK